ncbi:11582_t:CDS:2, partial [Entrophospora sp. SA101]
QDDPRITQKELINWCEQEFGIKVDQATISRTLKHSYEYLDNETNLLQNPLQKKPFEDNEQVAKLNVLEAILFIKTVWRDDVTINTIANCWKHT